MIRYELTATRDRKVTLTLNVQEPEAWGQLEFEGDEAAIDDVKWGLFGCLGLDGHLIRESTTPIDLAAAMGNVPMRPFAPKRVAGDEILARYVRKAPPYG
jgi:hypothetical protein